MTRIFLFLLSLTLLASCNKKASTMTAEEALNLGTPFLTVNNILDAWHQAATDAEGEPYFGAMAEDSYFIGTDALEVWSKQEFYDFAIEYFDRGSAWDFKVKSRNLHFSDDNEFAWFDETLDTWMGTCRGSGVLQFNPKAETYEIKHYVLSLTVPNDLINDVIRAIGEVEPRDN